MDLTTRTHYRDLLSLRYMDQKYGMKSTQSPAKHWGGLTQSTTPVQVANTMKSGAPPCDRKGRYHRAFEIS